VNNLGVLYAQYYGDAVAAFRYGLSYPPDNDALNLNLARVYMINGEREQAHEVLAHFLELHPNNTLARSLLRQTEPR
jgi:cytochrome c-type biogenesis protein CcmH/NrfG